MAQNLHTGTETSGGLGTGQPVASSNCIALFVNVTALAGITVALTVRLQDSVDGSTWVDVPGMASVTILAPGLIRVGSTGGTKVSENIRVAWTLTGIGPSATFSADYSYE